MTFLSPVFLYGLFALAIPVIIHLFNFRRTRRVYFTNTRFLRDVKEVSTTKLKVKHWLILASRILFLTFLVLAFAQPFIPADENNSDTGVVTIYLDNSFSMTNEVDIDRTAFELGINYIYSIIDQFPADTKYKLLTNDFAPFSNSFKSKDEILELTTVLKTSGISRSANEILRRINTDNGLRNGQQIFWITDFQKASFGSLQTLKEDTTNRHNLLPINFTSTSNIYIDSASIDKAFIIQGEKLNLQVHVVNKGSIRKEDVLLKVFVNEVQVGSVAETFDPYQEKTLSFEIGSNVSTINRCRISIEEYPVTFDNEFYLTLNMQDRINILEIKPQGDASDITRVFGNRQLFDLQSYTSDGVDLTAVPVADLIVLNGLDQIRPSLNVVLQRFLSAGGSVAVVPGMAPSLTDFSSLIASRSLRLVDSTAAQSLAPIDLDNPFFANVFEKTDGNTIMPEAIQLLSWGRDRQALLTFRNGEPFLSQISNGAGTTYFFASPFANGFSNFTLNAIFVPVMYKMAANSVTSNERLYYYLSEELLNIKLDSVRRDKVLQLIGDGVELVPSQRLLTDRVLLEVPRFSLVAGFYDLMDEGVQIASIAFNIDRQESDLEQYTREVLESEYEFTENINIFSASNAEEFSQQLSQSFAGLHLWKYALVLALIFLLGEILLIRFL